MPESIRVTCAIIERKGKILVAQRGEGMSLPGKWEFPGGKIDDGETEEECILREIREELDIEIDILEKMEEKTWKRPDRSITLIPFICEYMDGKLKPHEHSEVKWMPPHRVPDLDWAEADVPVLEAYLRKIFWAKR